MRLKRLLARRELWSIAIYKLESRPEILRLNRHKPIYMFGETGFRTGRDYQSTVADPFLFAFGGTLYMFYEVKTDHDHGEIWAQSLSEAGDWVPLGKVLGEHFHLSYPQVFEHGGRVYMIPEAAHSGRVLLYSAVHFPTQWEVCATLVSDPLLDPTMLFVGDGDFLLYGTTRGGALNLYHSSVLEGPFIDTGIIISKDKGTSRCAGNILEIDGLRYRPAQDCSRVYGERIRLLQVLDASSHGYAEKMSVPDMFISKPKWMSVGSHHLSAVDFGGGVYVAVDGRRMDRFINTLLLGVLKFLEMFFKMPLRARQISQ